MTSLFVEQRLTINEQPNYYTQSINQSLFVSGNKNPY